MPGVMTRGNIIKGHKLEGPLADGDEDSAIEGVDGHDVSQYGKGTDATETDTSTIASSGKTSSRKGHTEKGAKLQHEFLKQQNSFSGPLLPSEVMQSLQFYFRSYMFSSVIVKENQSHDISFNLVDFLGIMKCLLRHGLGKKEKQSKEKKRKEKKRKERSANALRLYSHWY